MFEQETSRIKSLFTIIISTTILQIIAFGGLIAVSKSNIQTATNTIASHQGNVYAEESFLRSMGYLNPNSFLESDKMNDLIHKSLNQNVGKAKSVFVNFFTQRLQMISIGAIVIVLVGFAVYFGLMKLYEKTKKQIFLFVLLVLTVISLVWYVVLTIMYLTQFMYGFPTLYMVNLVGVLSCISIIIIIMNVSKTKKS